jgi:hypothetical protein
MAASGGQRGATSVSAISHDKGKVLSSAGLVMANTPVWVVVTKIVHGKIFTSADVSTVEYNG